jgi:mitochondrial fission protein ELM1
MRKHSSGKTFVVQLQDPRIDARHFDLVAPPAHDRLVGEGIFPILGSPHRVTPERLSAARATFANAIDPLPGPLVAVLIGGKSKAFDLSERRARALAKDIRTAVLDVEGSILMTFSRRTPKAAQIVLKEGLKDLPGLIYEGEGENPYFGFLAAANYVIVTKDSVNMVAEAASTGVPIFIADVDGDQWRKRLFHADLTSRGMARPFEGRLYPFAYEALRETDRLADEILRRLFRPREALQGNDGRS